MLQYGDTHHQPKLDVNVTLHGGNIHVAQGAQITGSSVGDVSGLVLRDNMIVVQRSDIAEPLEVRRERLTGRFLHGLKQLSTSKLVVLFFESTEKMSDLNYLWLWEQLLKPVVEGELPNVRAVLLGQRPPPTDRDLNGFLALVELKPLCVDDIAAYIAKRAEGMGISAEAQRELAHMLQAMKGGRPADIASGLDLFLASRKAE